METIQPQSVGDDIYPPAKLSPKQEDLCQRLDDLYSLYNLKTKPSDMLRGAIFAARLELTSNPDWKAQAAHSLRDILYPFYSREVNDTPTNKTEILEKYGSVRSGDAKVLENLGRMWGQLCELAHHGHIKKYNIDINNFSLTDFENLLSEFEKNLLDALSRQIDIHKEADEILEQAPSP